MDVQWLRISEQVIAKVEISAIRILVYESSKPRRKSKPPSFPCNLSIIHIRWLFKVAIHAKGCIAPKFLKHFSQPST
jgi:hypothetical protein